MNIFERLQTNKTPEKLHEEEMIRLTLEAAASRIERLSGSEVYERAWKRAAEVVRSMKP